MAALGHTTGELPSPFNVFENVSIGDGGTLSIEPPLVRAGEFATLRAELDVVLVLSACPMDIANTNGPDGRSKPVAVEITRSGERSGAPGCGISGVQPCYEQRIFISKD